MTKQRTRNLEMVFGPTVEADTYYVYGGRRPKSQPASIRAEIAQLRAWAKMLREAK